MPHLRPARCWPCSALVLVLAVAVWSHAGRARAESGFPFNHEFRLDAAPMKGSRRVPSLDIGTNGATEITLWCNTVRSQFIVVGDTITILAGPRTERQCSPEQLRGDEDVLAALSAVTNWRFDDDLLTLTGPRTVRFRLLTN